MALWAGLLAGPAAAQTETAEPPLEFSEEASVAWVLVPVTVENTTGYLRDLAREAFTLRVDGQPVPFTSFDAGADAPISLIYLQDLSGSMANSGKLEASREGLRFFLANAKPGDEFAVATFASGRTQVEVPFTDNLAAVAEAIDTWEGYGTTALHDAVAWLPDIEVTGRNQKRAALLVTDGVDNASVLAPEQARGRVRQAELPVYVLAIAGQEPEEAPPATQALIQLAEETGGGYHPVAGPDELKEVYVSIAEELRYQYVLGFATRGSGPAGQHRIEVEVAGSGLTLRHRRSYQGYAPDF